MELKHRFPTEHFSLFRVGFLAVGECARNRQELCYTDVMCTRHCGKLVTCYRTRRVSTLLTNKAYESLSWELSIIIAGRGVRGELRMKPLLGVLELVILHLGQIGNFRRVLLLVSCVSLGK